MRHPGPEGWVNHFWDFELGVNSGVAYKIRFIILYYGLLCYFMLCCFAMLCYVLLCYIILCHAKILHYIMSCYPNPCYAMYAMLPYPILSSLTSLLFLKLSTCNNLQKIHRKTLVTGRARCYNLWPWGTSTKIVLWRYRSINENMGVIS